MVSSNATMAVSLYAHLSGSIQILYSKVYLPNSLLAYFYWQVVHCSPNCIAFIISVSVCSVRFNMNVHQGDKCLIWFWWPTDIVISIWVIISCLYFGSGIMYNICINGGAIKVCLLQLFELRLLRHHHTANVHFLIMI